MYNFYDKPFIPVSEVEFLFSSEGYEIFLAFHPVSPFHPSFKALIDTHQYSYYPSHSASNPSALLFTQHTL
jgi:hypothetical protein